MHACRKDTILLEILGLLKNLFVHFIPVNRGIAVLGQEDDQISLEFGLDVVTAVIPAVSRYVC